MSERKDSKRTVENPKAINQSMPSENHVRVCVFGSATSGNHPAHIAAARSIAHTLHAHQAQLVYGGGTTGLMAELAKTFVVLRGSENVHGIIPRSVIEFERPGAILGEIDAKSARGSMGKTLRKRLGLASAITKKAPRQNPASMSGLLSEDIYGRTHVVPDLQSRKKLICQLVHEGAPGSGFIALSGGFGTMDELMEMIAFRQYGIHTRRICLLNIDGFWDLMMSWIKSAMEKGFIRAETMDALAVKNTADECFAWLRDG